MNIRADPALPVALKNQYRRIDPIAAKAEGLQSQVANGAGVPDPPQAFDNFGFEVLRFFFRTANAMGAG